MTHQPSNSYGLFMLSHFQRHYLLIVSMQLTFQHSITFLSLYEELSILSQFIEVSFSFFKLQEGDMILPYQLLFPCKFNTH